jgi:hypothetical protein
MPRCAADRKNASWRDEGGGQACAWGSRLHPTPADSKRHGIASLDGALDAKLVENAAAARAGGKQDAEGHTARVEMSSTADFSNEEQSDARQSMSSCRM